MSQYTVFEEKLNFLSHLIGLLFFLIACPFMLFKAILSHNPSNLAGLIIYSVGLIAVYATSSMYHFIKNTELKLKFRTLDHMAIFLLIGGTYTPVVNKFIPNPLATIFLTILWIILILGIFMKFFFMGRLKAFSIGLYVFLGCMVLFIIKPIVSSMPHDIFIFILFGGLSYLVGVLFYVQKHRKYTHLIWHIFVLTASIFHFAAIYKTTFDI